MCLRIKGDTQTGKLFVFTFVCEAVIFEGCLIILQVVIGLSQSRVEIPPLFIIEVAFFKKALDSFRKTAFRNYLFNGTEQKKAQGMIGGNGKYFFQESFDRFNIALFTVQGCQSIKRINAMGVLGQYFFKRFDRLIGPPSDLEDAAEADFAFAEIGVEVQRRPEVLFGLVIVLEIPVQTAKDMVGLQKFGSQKNGFFGCRKGFFGLAHASQDAAEVAKGLGVLGGHFQGPFVELFRLFYMALFLFDITVAGKISGVFRLYLRGFFKVRLGLVQNLLLSVENANKMVCVPIILVNP